MKALEARLLKNEVLKAMLIRMRCKAKNSGARMLSISAPVAQVCGQPVISVPQMGLPISYASFRRLPTCCNKPRIYRCKTSEGSLQALATDAFFKNAWI